MLGTLTRFTQQREHTLTPPLSRDAGEGGTLGASRGRVRVATSEP